MPTQIINLSLPEDLVKRIDKAAKREYASRSEYIRQALVSRLRSQDSDVWDELLAGADEVRDRAMAEGYKTDKDFAQAVQEVRKQNNQS